MGRNLFSVEPDFDHGEIPAVGVLLVNLGTPEAPTAPALRRYLKQFLWDPRVIELPRSLWWLILNLFILPRRPRASAELYANIWTEDGSPLLVIARRLATAVAERLQEHSGTPLHVVLGMTYGEPSVPRALAELKQKGCRRLLILPLFSHYSSSSTGATFDAVMKELTTWRWVPEVRTIHQFHDEPALIQALAGAIREHWGEHGEPERLVTSYHGTPRRYLTNGDPYHCLCHKTTRLIAAELGLAEAGGETFGYIPCLNDRPPQVELLADLIRRNLGGWVTAPSEWDQEVGEATAERSWQLARALKARS